MVAGLADWFVRLPRQLRSRCFRLADVSQLDAVLLLSPFLEVVRSGDTSGPITAAALASVDKFITYSLVHRDSPSLAAAMTGVAGAGTHCKFEASDSVSDEAVLLKILDVLRHTLTSDLGGVLSDEAVCEMMETGLSMCCQMRLSGEPSLPVPRPGQKADVPSVRNAAPVSRTDNASYDHLGVPSTPEAALSIGRRATRGVLFIRSRKTEWRNRRDYDPADCRRSDITDDSARSYVGLNTGSIYAGS